MFSHNSCFNSALLGFALASFCAGCSPNNETPTNIPDKTQKTNKHTLKSGNTKKKNKPHKCETALQSANDTLKLTGYGDTLYEAKDSLNNLIFHINFQLSAPKLLEAALSISSVGKQNANNSNSSTLKSILSSLFSSPSIRLKTTCKPMIFPNNKVPQWHSTWKAGDVSVTTIATSPTAAIEESRASACYQFLANRMRTVSNNTFKTDTPELLKPYLNAWIDASVEFSKCHANRPRLSPQNGTTRLELARTVRCEAQQRLSSYFTSQSNSESNVATISSRIDRTRHLLYQKMRISASLSFFSDFIHALSNHDPTLSNKAFSSFWYDVSQVTTKIPVCHYIGSTKAIEWNTSSRIYADACSVFPPSNKKFKVDSTDSMTALENFCIPNMEKFFTRIHKKQMSLLSLDHLLRCINHCYHDMQFILDENSQPPKPIGNVMLNKRPI